MVREVKAWTPESAVKMGQQFEEKSPQELLSWALGEFHPDIALACSFGAEDVVLADMVLKINPKARVFYLDTGFLFPETLELKDRVVQKYGITPIRVASETSVEEFQAHHGEALWSREPDQCCNLRKVEPLQAFLGSGLRAWITGIRRDQAPTRANAKTVEWDAKFSLVKVNPLVRWSSGQVWDYIVQNQVPYCVLHDRGYPSIGCWPCTRQVKQGDDPRAGRWAGFNKTECGLHQ